MIVVLRASCKASLLQSQVENMGRSGSKSPDKSVNIALLLSEALHDRTKAQIPELCMQVVGRDCCFSIRVAFAGCKELRYL